MEMWMNYSIMIKLEEQNRKYQTALFLHIISPDALTIYNKFQFTTTQR